MFIKFLEPRKHSVNGMNNDHLHPLFFSKCLQNTCCVLRTGHWGYHRVQKMPCPVRTCFLVWNYDHKQIPCPRQPVSTLWLWPIALLQGQAQGQSEVTAQQIGHSCLKDMIGICFKPQLFFTVKCFAMQPLPLWAVGIIILEPCS